MEECAEVQKCASKALRFGLTEVMPSIHASNVERLNRELNDVKAIIELLREDHILPASETVDDLCQIEEKKAKVSRYMEYSRSLGTLETKS
jgi:hypothetical protein